MRFIKVFKRGKPTTIVIIYALVTLLIWCLFSDFFVENVINNSKALFLIKKYRGWVFYVITVAIVYHLVKIQIRKFIDAHEALKKSEDSYQILVENLREDYFFFRHSKTEPFENITPSIRNILGYTVKDFKENYRNYYADKMVGDYLDRHQKLFSSGIKHPPYEVDVLHADRSKRILEVKEIPIIDEHGEIVAVEGIVKDVTDYRRVETELKDKDSKFQLLFETTNDGILMLKGEKIVDCNVRALELFGCSMDQIIMQMPFSYKFSPPTQPNGRASIELGRERIIDALNGENQRFEWEHIRINGSAFLAEVSINGFSFNNEDFIQLIIRDITEKKISEESLIQREEHFRGIYEKSIFGLFRTTIEEGRFLSGNNATAKMFGYLDIQDAINKRFELFSLIPKKERNKLLNLLDKEGSISDYEVTYQLPNGGDKYILLSAILNKSENYLDGSIVDITKRKLAELEIQKNEKKFREILENSRDLLYKLNAKTGDYDYISPSVYDVLGYAPEEILAKDVDDLKTLLHHDDLGRAKDIFAKLMKDIPVDKTSFTAEYRMRHKNGDYRWLSDRYRILRDSNRKVTAIVGNIIDVTMRKEAQEALKESEIRFRNMADNIQNGVTINEGGKNVYVNDRLKEILGYSKEELLSFTDFQFAAPEEKKRLQTIVNELKKTNDRLEELEFWIIRKDGSRRCILNRYSYNSMDGKKKLKYIITSDITERKMMEIALRENEEKFRELSNLLPQTIFESDVKGNITYANSRGLKQFGYTYEELKKGVSIYDVVIPSQRAGMKKNVSRLLKGEKFDPPEYTAVKNNGETFPMIVYPSFIKKQGEIIGLRGIIFDTTNQKKIQEELVLAKEAAEAANKAKSIFLTNLSHELRTPMNSIFGMTELIKKTNLSDKQYDFLKVITESSENLLSFINDILIIPHIEANTLNISSTPFKIQDIQTSVIGLVSYQAELKGVNLVEGKGYDDDLIVYNDPARLNQILINLLELSIKYTDKGEVRMNIEVLHSEKGKVVLQFAIGKTGKPIPEDLLNSSQNDFKVAHLPMYNDYGSYGLGFVIANQLIKALGTELIIEVADNETMFHFNLELKRGTNEELEKSEVSCQVEEEKEKEYLKNIKILLVEDEIFNQLVVQSLVEEWDCEIDIAENGIEAIDKLKTKHFDIVLMDIIMPEMDGVETTEFIRNKLPEPISKIPIIAITANPNIDNHKEYLKIGINHTICKPFKARDLFHILVKSLVPKKKDSNILIVEEPIKKYEKGEAKRYDLRIIENIAKNNKVLIIKMIQVFIDKTKDELTLLKQYIKSNDVESILNILHKMKPAIVYMGIHEVENTIAKIQATEKGELERAIPDLVDNIERIMTKVFKSLENDLKDIHN